MREREGSEEGRQARRKKERKREQESDEDGKRKEEGRGDARIGGIKSVFSFFLFF